MRLAFIISIVFFILAIIAWNELLNHCGEALR